MKNEVTAKRLSIALSNLNMRPQELAQKSGVNKASISQYMSGAHAPSNISSGKIGAVLGVNPLWLMGFDVPMERNANKNSASVLYNKLAQQGVDLSGHKGSSFSAEINENAISLLEKFYSLDKSGQDVVMMVLDREIENIKKIKEQATQISELQKAILPCYMITYYQRVASAGSGEYLFDDLPTDLIEVPDTPLAHKADFVIGVNGNSMEPTYHDGDKVFVKKADEIPKGSIGVFLRGNECFVKELGVDRLISHNEEYGDIPASEDIRVVGLVIGKVEEV